MNRVALFARPSLAVIYLATAQRSTLPAPLPLRQQRRAIVEYAQRTHRSVVAQVVESRRRSTAGGFARLRDLIKDLALGIRYPNVDTVLVHDAHGFGGTAAESVAIREWSFWRGIFICPVVDGPVHIDEAHSTPIRDYVHFERRMSRALREAAHAKPMFGLKAN